MTIERVIKLIGPVDTDMLKYFIKCVNILVAGKTKKIKIILHSGGGEALVGLAIAEYMRIHQEDGIQFEVLALGDCASAATIILVCGDIRRMTARSWVMVHEDSIDTSGSTSDVEVAIRYARRLEDQWSTIFAAHSYVTKESWDEYNKSTTYLDAYQCKSWGIVDEVV